MSKLGFLTGVFLYLPSLVENSDVIFKQNVVVIANECYSTVKFSLQSITFFEVEDDTRLSGIYLVVYR